MDWSEIRAQYALLVERSGLTQHAIAERGGLKGQGTISKLLTNHHLGPSVETFVRAVIGTGSEVSAFFAALERGAGGATPRERTEHAALARLHELEMACETLAALLLSWSNAVASEATAASPATPDGGAHGDQASSTEGDRSTTPRAARDLRRVEAIVQASTARILADIALLEQRLGPDAGGSGGVPTGAPKP
jgi:transcriptional regulator with XRE-family HTH domain